MSKTGAELAKWAQDAVNDGQHVYWYGTYMNPCTSSKLKSKKKQYPSHYTSDRMPTYERHIQEGKICSDCVGVIKGYLWELDGVIKYQRDGIPDVSAKGMYNSCKVKGRIENNGAALPVGALVFNSSLTHVGVYIGNGKVSEARSFAKGFQTNLLKNRTFTLWGLCPWCAYDDLGETGKGVDDVPTVQKGSKGLAVKICQQLLISKGYSLPKWGADGDFGSETRNRVKEFQINRGLECDGIVGAKTWAALAE